MGGLSLSLFCHFMHDRGSLTWTAHHSEQTQIKWAESATKKFHLGGWGSVLCRRTTLPHSTGDRLTISPQLLPFIFVPAYLFSCYQVQLTGSKTQLAKDLQRIITSCRKREGLDLHERDVLGQREKRPR